MADLSNDLDRRIPLLSRAVAPARPAAAPDDSGCPGESHHAHENTTGFWRQVQHWGLRALEFVVPLPFAVIGIVQIVRSAARDPDRVGLGGIMVAIALIQMLVVFNVGVAVDDYVQRAAAADVSAGPASSFLVPIAAFGVAFVATLGAFVAMLWRSRRVPGRFALQWLVIAAALGIEFAWLVDMSGHGAGAILQQYGFEEISKLVIVTIVAAPSLWYLRRSHQARNTFVR